jgi:hypothetical protein
MARVGPAQELRAREERDAGGGDEIDAGPGPLDQSGVRPAQQAAGIIRERCGRGERRPNERCTPRCLQTVADDIADDQHRGILGPLGHQVKVAADPLGEGRQERRGQFQAGAPRQFGRGQRIADRAQILQLVLRRLKTLTQHGKILFAHRGFIAESHDQRVLAVLQGHPDHGCRAAEPQPPSAAAKLLIVLTTLFAHTRSIDSRGSGSCRIVSHR